MREKIRKEISCLPKYSKSTPRPTVDYLDIIKILDKNDEKEELISKIVDYRNTINVTSMYGFESGKDCACMEILNMLKGGEINEII